MISYQFQRNESVSQAVRRIVTVQTALAARELGAGFPTIHEGVHNARKCFKKIRSLLRLVRSDLGEDCYRRENNRFRHAGRQLAVLRDAAAIIETCDRLAEHYPETVGCTSVLALREALIARRNRIAEDEQGRKEQLQRLSRELEAVPSSLINWPSQQQEFPAIARGLKRNFRRGRRAMKKACIEPSAEHFHQWRKRVKDYWYHRCLLSASWPEAMAQCRCEVKSLEELLGHIHDLEVLQLVLVSEGAALGAEACQLLGGLACNHQHKLQLQAFELGARVYATSPAALVEEINSHWQKWRQSQGLD